MLIKFSKSQLNNKIKLFYNKIFIQYFNSHLTQFKNIKFNKPTIITTLIVIKMIIFNKKQTKKYKSMTILIKTIFQIIYNKLMNNQTPKIIIKQMFLTKLAIRINKTFLNYKKINKFNSNKLINRKNSTIIINNINIKRTK